MWWQADCATEASRRYRRRAFTSVAAYLVVVWITSRMVHHAHPQGWVLYCWAMLPAVPVILTLALMGQYLREETDEYQRMMTTRSILIGTAALLGTLVVNDFARSFTPAGAVPPFASFILFSVAFALAQLVQKFRNRVRDDEPSA